MPDSAANETTIYGEISANLSNFQSFGVGLPNKYFQGFELIPNTDGFYNIISTSNLDLYGYLYNDSFNPTDPIENLIIEDDDGAGDYQFILGFFLEANNTYILIVTTFNEAETGNFTIEISGPSIITYADFSPPFLTTTQSQATGY